MKKTDYSALVILVILVLNAPIRAQSIIPNLDASFNGTGITALNLLQYFEPNCMAIQADGKILTGGYGNNDPSDPFDGILYRLNTDGVLDASFADGGVLVLDIDGGSDAIQGILALPNNKILVLLESAFRTILVQLNPDGSRDIAFGNEGFGFVPTGQYEFCTEILQEADGHLLILSEQVVQGNRYIGTVRRCNSDGTLDKSYGSSGTAKLVLDFSNNFSGLAGCLQPDGKLLVTGRFGQLSSSAFPVVRLNPDGSFDNSFSNDGIVIKPLGNAIYDAIAICITVDAAGKIYVGGVSPTTTTVPMTIISLTASGGTNGSFGSFGVARVPFPIYASCQKLIIQPDGKILAGGYTYNDPPTSTSLAFTRLNTNGTPDLTFGNQLGRFVSTINAPFDVQAVFDMKLQSDGRLVPMAWMKENTNFGQLDNNTSCFMLRYLTDITVKAEEPSVLFQNAELFPNPAPNDATTLSYTLDKPCSVTLYLYDSNGKELATLGKAEKQNMGLNQLKVQLPSQLIPGTYFIGISDGLSQKVVKLIKN